MAQDLVLFALIDWDDNMSNDIPISSIVLPRKNFDEYKVGERVQAKLHGFKGLFWGAIAAIDEDRQWLRSKLNGPRPVQKRIVEANPDDKENGLGKNLKSDADVINKGSSVNKRKSLTTSKEQQRKKPRLPDIHDVEWIPSIDDADEKEVEKDYSVEAKKVKAAENKKKRETNQQRDIAHAVIGNQLLESQSPGECVCCKKLEEKIEGLTEVIESLLNCRDCLKKVYKKNGTKSVPTPRRSSPRKQLITSTPKKEMSTPRKSPGNTLVKTPRKETPVKISPFKATSGKMSSPSCGPANAPATSDANDDECYVGESIHNIKVQKTLLANAIKISKNAEKLSLSLIPIVLSREEIDTVTMYGNRQHNKLSLCEQKREAIKSQIFSIFHKEMNKEEQGKVWDKLVQGMNDKIRGLRRGKYKDISL